MQVQFWVANQPLLLIQWVKELPQQFGSTTSQLQDYKELKITTILDHLSNGRTEYEIAIYSIAYSAGGQCYNNK